MYCFNIKCLYSILSVDSIDHAFVIYFSGLRLSTTGPILSPVSLLWVTCEPSQYGHCKDHVIEENENLNFIWKPKWNRYDLRRVQQCCHLRSSISNICRMLPFQKYPRYQQSRLLWIRSNAPNCWRDLVEFSVGPLDRMPNMTCSRFQRRLQSVAPVLPNHVLKN